MLQLSLKFQNLRVSGTKIPLDFNRQDRTRNTISTIMEVAPPSTSPPPQHVDTCTVEPCLYVHLINTVTVLLWPVFFCASEMSWLTISYKKTLLMWPPH